MAVGIVKALVKFAAYGFAAAVAVLCAIYLWDRLFRCVGCSALWRQTRAVILALLVAATVATIEAQKRGGTTGTTGILPVDSGTTVATGVPPVESTATNTLHLSAIAVPTSGTVALTAAWPENFLDAGQTLDVLASAELQNWAWLTNGVVSTGATNNTWVLENQPPSNCFYKVVVRDSLTDMDDPDGDGLINLHEFRAGCNVWTYDGTGTALYAFCHAIDDRIRVDGSLPVEVYPETQLGWTAQFGTERNENCWAYGIDISGASPWNSSEWGLKAGTAISRRHIIFAHHYQIPPGNTIKFIGTDNSTNIFTIVANKSLAGTDITIGLLSGDLPESVTPSYILPTDYGRFVGDARRLPMLFIDNEENARITDSNALPYQSKDSDGLVPVDAKRRLYFDAVVSGDSGGPKYFVCGNAVILACALHTYGTGASGRGPFVTFYRKRIQAVMDELCPGYTLRVFDMSTFRRLDNED